MAEDEWWPSAKALAHVKNALVAAGGSADEAAAAIVAKAALGLDVLEAMADRLSPLARHYSGRNVVSPWFWGEVLKETARPPLASGTITCRRVDRQVVTSRTSSRRPDRIDLLIVDGVRFRRQQVEALWPLPHTVIDNTPAADRIEPLAPAGSVDLATAWQSIFDSHCAKSKADIDSIKARQLQHELQALAPVQPSGSPYSPGYLRSKAYDLRKSLREKVRLEPGHQRRFAS